MKLKPRLQRLVPSKTKINNSKIRNFPKILYNKLQGASEQDARGKGPSNQNDRNLSKVRKFSKIL